MADVDVIRLKEFDSRAVLPLEFREAGTYTQKLAIVGNSFISKLFVFSIDAGASIKIDYHDFGVGGELGENFPLPSHALQTSASLIPDKVLVTNFNDKPVLTATVTGGSATFGVYLTVVTASSTDIDNALQKEGDPYQVGSDKGLPIVLLDPVLNEWRFWRANNGVPDVRIVGNVAVGEPGNAFFLDFDGATDPGNEQTLITYTVADGFNLNLLSVILVSVTDARFRIEVDGDLIGSGATGAANSQVNFAYRIARTFASGKILTIKATVRAGSPLDEIQCYLQGTLSDT